MMKHIECRELRVGEALKEDVYKDIVRVHWQERGKQNRIGAIVGVSIDVGHDHLFSLRGLADDHKGEILFDHVARTELGLKLGEVHQFAIRKTNMWEKLLWAVSATDPAARIAAWIAVWSGILGILGLVLGAIGTWPVVKEWFTAEKIPYNTSIY